MSKPTNTQRRRIEAALRTMRARLGIPEGRALTRQEALAFIERPIWLLDPTQQPRGRGRPPKRPKFITEALERRRAAYATLKLRAENAAKGAATRRVMGDRRREWVYDEAMKLVAARIAPHRLAGRIAAASQAVGAPAMSEDRARRILRELGFRRS